MTLGEFFDRVDGIPLDAELVIELSNGSDEMVNIVTFQPGSPAGWLTLYGDVTPGQVRDGHPHEAVL